MRQITTTAFLGMLALTITGCPSSDNPQTTNPSPSPSPTSVVVTTPPATKPPLVANNPTSAAFLAPGLIQPTNANQRTKQVAKGNRDPFAALFLPVPVAPISTGNISNAPTQAPQIVTSTASSQTNRTQTSRSVTNRQSSSGSVATNNPRTAANRGTVTNRSTPTNPRTAASRSTAANSINRTPAQNQNPGLPPNPTQPNGALQPDLPPPADTTLANNVVVMGVIQIGEQTQAIVQVPSEATSRYVQVGQTLSNGQVLVKRIELNAGAEPIVILEQYGVEISKAVGEQSPSQEQQTTPTAALPLPSPNPSTTTAAVPFLPPQNTSTTTAELPAPPQNTNPVGTTISVPALQPANQITPALVK